MSLQKLIEERGKLFDEKFPDITHIGCDTRFSCGDMKMDVKKFNSESINMIIDGVVEMVEKYQEFCKKTRDECLAKEKTMIAYDMDSRQVAAQHLISQLQTLKK